MRAHQSTENANAGPKPGTRSHKAESGGSTVPIFQDPSRRIQRSKFFNQSDSRCSVCGFPFSNNTNTLFFSPHWMKGPFYSTEQETKRIRTTVSDQGGAEAARGKRGRPAPGQRKIPTRTRTGRATGRRRRENGGDAARPSFTIAASTNQRNSTSAATKKPEGYARNRSIKVPLKPAGVLLEGGKVWLPSASTVANGGSQSQKFFRDVV